MTMDVETDDIPEVVTASIERVRNIATLPAVAIRIIELTEDPESGGEQLSQVIASDPALSTRILRVINSSFYGLPRQVLSIHRAVSLLGLNSVRNIAIAGSLHKVYQSRQTPSDLDAGELWKHSAAVATGASLLASRTTPAVSTDEAFLAGLIHDVGIMIEMQASGPQFNQMMQNLSDDSDLTFCRAEKQIMGASHEQFGTGLCRKWNFPPELERVAGYHHRPMELEAADQMLPAIVHVADIMAARTGIGYTGTVDSSTVCSSVLNRLGLSAEDVDTLLEELPAKVEETLQILS
jgi:HD-like signal output (HDOD) protein